MREFPSSAHSARFGAFEVDLRAGELRKKGIRVKLQTQPFLLLVTLLKRQGELVTREELCSTLWPEGTFIDFDHSLGTAVNKLREVLGDSASSPRFIETLPRRGYRFIAPVEAIGVAEEVSAGGDAPPPDAEPVTEDRPGAAAERRPRYRRLWISGFVLLLTLSIVFAAWRIYSGGPPPRTIRSLAVLPLENLSGDPSQEYFSDGMTDELITELGQINDLRVISRTSVMTYKTVRKPLPQIARELNVDGVVEGTVLRAESQVRITA